MHNPEVKSDANDDSFDSSDGTLFVSKVNTMPRLGHHRKTVVILKNT